MLYSLSPAALIVFLLFVGAVLGLSFRLRRNARLTPQPHVPWLVHGFAFAGDYLSAATLLGISGMIAFFGYDGFLYAIGLLAGWLLALFLIVPSITRLGNGSFPDTLNARFNSRGVRCAAALSTLVISLFFLVPQLMAGAMLLQPLLGLRPLTVVGFHISPFAIGLSLTFILLVLIVMSAGLAAATWVQCLKGPLLVLFSLVLVFVVLRRGLTTDPSDASPHFREPHSIHLASSDYLRAHHLSRLPETGGWIGKPYLRLKDDTGRLSVWRKILTRGWTTIDTPAEEVQFRQRRSDGSLFVNGLPQGPADGHADFFPVGNVASLPSGYNPPGSPPATGTGPLGPASFLSAIQQSTIVAWRQDKNITDTDGSVTSIWYPVTVAGSDLLAPGNHPAFAGLRAGRWPDRLNFLSLMLALLCGTAALPHIFARYAALKNQAAARNATIVAIVAIGLFFILTLYLGLGAMTSGMLDPTNPNMAAPLLARSFGNLPFALLAAAAFSTVLGAGPALLLTAAGAVTRNLLNRNLDDREQIATGKIIAVVLAVLSIPLALLLQHVNLLLLLAWTLNIAAAANLPAITMRLFWKRTTRQGITASILVGLLSSLLWIALSPDAFEKIYHLPPTAAPIPFNHPALLTLPLSWLTLIVISLATRKSERLIVKTG